MKKFITYYFLGTVFTYLLFSFALWNLDVSTWKEEVRVFFAMMNLGLLIISAMAGSHQKPPV